MSEWITVAAVYEIPLNAKAAFLTSHGSIIVVNLDGDFYAVEDVCSHDGGQLSDGWLTDGELVCPRHGAHFCPKTGDALTPPAYEAINTFPVRIQDGVVQVRVG